MSIAEKILWEHEPDWEHNSSYDEREILAAMQSYADFFYWLGKEGWVDFGNDEWAKGSFDATIFSLEQLYDQYIKTKV